MIEPNHADISIRRQCELIGMNRATYYWQPAAESKLNLKLMKLIDQEYTRAPYYGYRKMTVRVNKQLKNKVNHKRVARLMQKMGLQAIYPRKKTSISDHRHKKYPYLLRNLEIDHPNQVWAADITYIPMQQGFMYLVAVMDWYSRYVITWELSNTLESGFCITVLQQALQHGQPEIFNTDQGSQFTSDEFTTRLETAGIQISMDGRGRAFDNIFIERLWRSVKYEDIYIKDYSSVMTLQEGLRDYFMQYNYERPHQSLEYKTPGEVHFDLEEGSEALSINHLNFVDSWSS